MSSNNNNGNDEKRHPTATKAPVDNDRVEKEKQEAGFVEEEEHASTSLTTGSGISSNGMEKAVGLKGAKMEDGPTDKEEEVPDEEANNDELKSFANFHEEEKECEDADEQTETSGKEFYRYVASNDVNNEIKMIEEEEEPPEEDESDNRKDSYQISNEEDNGEDAPLITSRRTRPGAERVYPSGHEGDSSYQLDILEEPMNDIESQPQTSDIATLVPPEEPMVPEEPMLQDNDAVPVWFEFKKGIRCMVMGVLVVVVVVGIILLSVLLTISDDEPFFSIGSFWGGSRGDLFGASLSLSDKGDVMAVGSPYHNEGELSDVGLIQIFRRQEANDRWEEIFNITGEEEDDMVGSDSLSLSGDGKQIIFGSPLASNYTGYVKIVEVETGKTMKLVGEKEYDYFGWRVFISSNGDRVAVSASGYIRVFDRMEDGSLTPIGDDISAVIPSVALSASGAVLGFNSKGHIRIMKWDGSRWSLIGEEILGEHDNDYFGGSLDLSADGQSVLIGTLGGNYIKAYKYDGTSWEMMGNKLEGGSDDGNMFGFGYSVSISNGGNRIIVGSPDFSSDRLEERGRALVYHYHNGSWDQINDDIVGKKTYDYAGWSVSISGDGHHFAVGIPYADSEDQGNVGSVIIYRIE